MGFARVSRYSDRCVYEGVGEHGVYVDAATRGQGHGRRLLDALAAEAERRGMYKLTSRIFTTNAASRAVHRAAGFAEVGIQRRHGRLDGEWKDCVLVERLARRGGRGGLLAAAALGVLEVVHAGVDVVLVLRRSGRGEGSGLAFAHPAIGCGDRALAIPAAGGEQRGRDHGETHRSHAASVACRHLRCR